MADSLWLSDFPDNKDRDAFDQWLEDRSDRFADLIAKEIKRITTNAYDAFVKSVDETAVTASGDINSIDSVIPEWNLVVEGDIMDEINQTYLTGSVSAYTVASGVNAIPPTFSSQWAQVVNQQAVDYALKANNRIKDVGKTLWNDMRKRVSKTIAQGSTTEQLKADIEALTNFSEYRADTIARTEIASAYINGNYQGDVALGEYGPVEKVWVASGDARTRATHLAAQTASEANPVPFSQPFSVGGVEMMYPHSPGAPAKEVVNCRCHYESYYVGDTRPDGSIVQIGDVKVTSPVQGQPLQQEQVVTQPVEATPLTYASAADYQADYFNNVDFEKREIVKEWQQGGYETINAVARGIAKSDPDTARAVSLLDETISQAPPLPSEIVVYRGQGVPLKTPLSEGDVFTDNAFAATSFAKSVAKDFATQAGDGVLFEIRVPQGSRGLVVNTGRDFDMEKEFLLGRGNRFRVLEVRPEDIVLELIL